MDRWQLSDAMEWALAVFFALALVGLVAFARGGIGDDDRVPDREHVVVVVH